MSTVMPRAPLRAAVAEERGQPLDPDALVERLELELGADPGVREAEELAVSGVLVPIVLAEAGPLVLLTRRSEDLPSHPGQISYPGGRREPGELPRDAALREAREEVGLDPEDVTLVGHLADYATHNDDLVCAYVGLVEPPVALADPITPAEVDEHLVVPLRGLLDGRSAAPALPGGLTVADDTVLGTPYPVLSYEARTVEEAGAREVVHYWHLAEDTTLWGISGEVTARLLDRALDWSPPSKPREVGDMNDLMP